MRLPAVDPTVLPARTTSGYPSPFRERVLPREKRALGDAAGLTKIGINLTTLPPGKESSMRHHHSHEEEFVYVLEGEITLVTNDGEQVLRAGMCAGFPCGKDDAHQLINRSDKPVRYLEVGNRDTDDFVEYPDVDMALHRDAAGKFVFTHKDGSPYKDE